MIRAKDSARVKTEALLNFSSVLVKITGTDIWFVVDSGHGPTAHWGCESDSDCCNPAATCSSDKHCRLSCDQDKLTARLLGTGAGSQSVNHTGVGIITMAVAAVLLIAVGAGAYMFYVKNNQNQKQLSALQNKNYFEVDGRVDDEVEIAVTGGQE